MDYNSYVDHKNKMKIGLGLIAGLASAGVLLGSIFESPAEIIRQQVQPDFRIEDCIVPGEEDRNEIREKDTVKEKIRNLICRIPVRIRVVFFVPLWCLGNLLISVSELLFKMTLLPIVRFILSFLLQTLLLLAIIGICIRMMFPNLPWSKIFSKKTMLMVFFGSLFISIIDHLLPLFWNRYPFYRNLVRTAIGLAVIFILLRPFIRMKLKHRITYEIVYDNKTLGIGS